MYACSVQGVHTEILHKASLNQQRLMLIMTRWTYHRETRKFFNINAQHVESNKQTSVELDYIERGGRKVFLPDLTEPRKQTLHLNLLIPQSRDDKYHYHIPCPRQTLLIHPSTLILQTYICMNLPLGYLESDVCILFLLYLPQISLKDI